MKLFRCQVCGQVLHFENIRCETCGSALGYLPEIGLLSVIEREREAPVPPPAAAWPAAGWSSTAWPSAGWPSAGWPSAGWNDPQPGGTAEIWLARLRPDRRQRLCANAVHGACNWLVPAEVAERYCLACRHNRTVPDLTVPRNLLLWRKIEIARHRLFYTLIRLGLPLRTRVEDPDRGLAFDILSDNQSHAGPPVMFGHDRGLITLRVEEADDAERERMRLAMGETYRTLLGHVRHEVGHWFWDALVADAGPARLAAFRARFGDERQDYAAALAAYYGNGPPADWQSRFVTAYASAHPWEDWAETWAHYLHIVDTLETARAFGVRVSPAIAPGEPSLSAEVAFDPHAPGHPIEELVGEWLPLTFAVNGLNRSMGQPDLYPFVLSPPVVEKLGFIHRLVHAAPEG